MRHLLIYTILLIPFFASSQEEAQTPERRCRYRPSRAFLLSKSDTCYDLTRREADRAFAFRCWDEAALLYRAAKICPDADQKNRQEMNKRMEACRDSADQELRDSEQAAKRQARHTIAALRAKDASQLLKIYDRTLAYRLADFAGEYIAPSPNPECLQALLDAWYYVPIEHSGLENIQGVQVPFCYLAGYDLGDSVQVRFGRSSKSLKLYAFSPRNSMLYAWDADSLKPLEPMEIEKGLRYFDISPDGNTLLFFSENSLLFWRSPSETYRVNVSGLGRYCFNARGDEFYYFDKKEAKVYGFDIRGAYSRNKIKGEQRSAPRPLFSASEFEVLGMAFHDDHFWLGSDDFIVVFGKSESAKKDAQWQLEKALPLAASAEGATEVKFFMAQESAAFFNSEGVGFVSLPDSLKDGDTLRFGQLIQGMPLALDKNASQAAISLPDRDLIYVYTTDSADVRYGAYLQAGDAFAAMNGAFSPDGRWLAAATDTGTLKIWVLKDFQINTSMMPKNIGDAVFSQDGDYFATWWDEGWELRLTDEPTKILFRRQYLHSSFELQAISENWLAFHDSDEDSLSLENIANGKNWEFPVGIFFFQERLPVAIDDKGHFLAHAINGDSVVIRSLESGETIAFQKFSSNVSELKFIPNSNALMVSQKQYYYEISQTITKIWKPTLSNNQALHPVRLHDYNVELSAVAPNGEQVALADGNDIRVFYLDNLLDERIRIRATGQNKVAALAFHPNGTTLAAGYSDGLVIIWDLITGDERFHLKVDDAWIEHLSFSPDGNRMYISMPEEGFSDISLYSMAITPSLIRAAAQDENRRLVAFTPAQIRDYGLEKALDYPGNFKKLAASQDLPLIRSFFEYYRQQALSSNNIERVKTYFERASELYSELDEPSAQRALRPVMHEIYEDYNWKLLVRGKNEEAARVLNDLNSDKPLVAQKVAAHTALLRHDLSAAARLYADWTIRTFENPASYPFFRESLDSLKSKFRQLAEYDLLDERQRECICGMYANLLEINSICRNRNTFAAPPFDAETRLRWNIFQSLYTSSSILNHAKKTRLLQSALADAKTLYRQNPTRWQPQVEKTTLALVDAYRDWGVFEQGSARSATFYQQALNVLDSFGIFKTEEPRRLKSLSENHLNLGNYFLSVDKLDEATQQFVLGLDATDRLLKLQPADELRNQNYRDSLQSPLFTQLGMIRLFEGNAAAAETAFNQADETLNEGLPSYYFGHIDLLEGNEDEALGKYRSFADYRELGQAMFDVDRLAERFPEQRARLTAFVPRLREAVLQENSFILAYDADYWYYELKRNYADNNGQWERARVWTEKNLTLAQKFTGAPDASDTWKERKLDALLSLSYYLLFAGKNDSEAYSKSINYAKEAEEYGEKEMGYYHFRDLIKTNLAHAYLLRNRSGDRDTSILTYKKFLNAFSYERDNWEVLQKDFRDLHRAGVRWPNLKEVIEAIKPPKVELNAKEWEEMGIKSE